MATVEPQTFYVQPLLNDVFHERDLLDFGSPPRAGATSPPPSAGTGLNRLSQFVSSTAAAATQRRVAGRAGSPSLPESSSSESLADKLKVCVTCSVGYGNNLYIGASDGTLLWYTIEPVPNSSQGQTFILRNKTTLFPRRPISKLIPLPRISKLLALSESTLHFLQLPDLAPIPNTVIQSVRGVVTVAVDDAEGGEVDGTIGGGEMNVAVIKRRVVGLYRLGLKFTWIQDIPIPDTPEQLVRLGSTICLADAQKYSLIDLTGPHLIDILPISQAGPPDPEDYNSFRPEANIAIYTGNPESDGEFLVCSYMGEEAGSLGVFVNTTGDPVRGTITWESHPKSLAIEGNSVLALLHDNTVVIHSIDMIQAENPGDYTPQVIPFPGDLGLRSLSWNPYGIMVPHHERDEKMTLVSVPLLSNPRLRKASNKDSNRSPTRKLGTSPLLPPPLIASRGSSLAGESSVDRSLLTQNIEASSSATTLPPPGPFTTTVAETVLVTDDSIIAIAATGWMIRADQKLIAGKVEDASRMVEEERRRGKRGDIDGNKTTHTNDLRYMYTRLAHFYLKNTLFDDAAALFIRGRTDPRVVCRLFPDLTGKSIAPEDEVFVWRGMERDVRMTEDIESIVTASLGSGDLESKQSEKAQLLTNARSMFLDYLKKTRASRRKNSTSSKAVERKIDIAVDTCLCKLLAETGEIEELASILNGDNDALVEELEPFLIEAKQPWILSKVMLQMGRIDKVLAILKDIVDDVTPDDHAEYPLQQFGALLHQIKDPVLLREYGLWLVDKDVEQGLRIFMSQDTKSGVKLEDKPLIEDLNKISQKAGNRYLEFAVVQKKSNDRSLHDDLAMLLLDQCAAFLADEGVRFHYQEIYDEYVNTSPLLTYFTYFSDTAHDSPAKTARLKTILFLQGSPFFDLVKVSQRLEPMDMAYEKAIVLGRLGEHSKALKLLALTLKDSVSAEMYCTQAGEVLPPKIARGVTAKIPTLSAWAALGEVGRRRKGTVGGEVRETLVMELLRVYMGEGPSTSKKTAALLNAQAVHLDEVEVLGLVPDDWPVALMSDFFNRSLKRQQHEQAKWQILKAISAGENIQTSDEYATTVGRQPPRIEHAPAGGDGHGHSPDEGSIPHEEYSAGVYEKQFDFSTQGVEKVRPESEPVLELRDEGKKEDSLR